MARPSNRDLYRHVFPPRDWRSQVEAGIRKYHSGLGPDDPGGLAPIALTMLGRRGMDEIVRSLCEHYAVATRGRRLLRFDTDKDDGIDLADILIKCVIFGKQLRKPEYDLKKIETGYEDAGPEIRTVMFREMVVITKEILLHKGKGAPPKAQRNHLMVWLNNRLRERFKRQDCSKVISHLLHLTYGDSITPETVREKIRELSRGPIRERAKLAIERRLLKVYRITGNPDGRKAN